MTSFYNIVRGLLTLYYEWRRRREEKRKFLKWEACILRELADLRLDYARRQEDLDNWMIQRMSDILARNKYG